MIPADVELQWCRMVISTFNENWNQRLARLQRQIAEQPDGPVWLWSIRVRILQFIAARHGPDVRLEESPSDSNTSLGLRAWTREIDGAQDEAEDMVGPALPWHLNSAAVFSTAAIPPRCSSAMNPALANLQHINDSNRMRIDRGAQMQDVWLWWRDQWCCPSHEQCDNP
jgi:hypothetical protein